MKQITLPFNHVLEKFKLKLSVRSRSRCDVTLCNKPVTSAYTRGISTRVDDDHIHGWQTDIPSNLHLHFWQSAWYVRLKVNQEREERGHNERLRVCSNLIENHGNMASHRSRGSGSSSSRTHSVIYRPPNFISRGIVSCIAGGWDKKRGERGKSNKIISYECYGC